MSNHLFNEVQESHDRTCAAEEKAQRCNPRCPIVADLRETRQSLSEIAMMPAAFESGDGDLDRSLCSLTEMIGRLNGCALDGTDPFSAAGDMLDAEEWAEVEAWAKASALKLMEVYAVAHARRERSSIAAE